MIGNPFFQSDDRVGNQCVSIGTIEEDFAAFQLEVLSLGLAAMRDDDDAVVRFAAIGVLSDDANVIADVFATQF